MSQVFVSPSPSALSAYSQVVVTASNRLGAEERAAVHHFGENVLACTDKHLDRGRHKLASTDLVVGGLPLVRAALRQFGREVPEPLDYPAALHPWLHRELRRSTLAAVMAHVENTGNVAFVKPSSRTKRFTGFVLEDPYDYRVAGVSRREPVWVSSVVRFLSEYRYYVLDGQVVTCGVAVPGPEPDSNEVRKAVAAYEAAGAPRAYALDFGVLLSGATALVEANDAFSLGLYPGADPDAYLEALAARWGELLGEPSAQ